MRRGCKAFKLVTHAGDQPLIGLETIARKGIGFQHDAVVGHVAARTVVPFGIGKARRQTFMVGILRGPDPDAGAAAWRRACGAG